MTWPEAIFYCVLAVCGAPVAIVFILALSGGSFEWPIKPQPAKKKSRSSEGQQ